MVKKNWIYSDSSLYFRKSENKTRSDTFDTFDVNGSIVEIYNPTNHRKAESGTAIFSGTAFVEIDYGEKLIEADVPCKYGAEYASVMCRGKAKILQNAADKCAALRILMREQTGEEHEINEKMVNAVCVIEINVDSYTAKACVK